MRIAVTLPHFGVFVRCSLLLVMWLTTGFLTFYSLIAVQMCNFASSNATAIFTLTAAIAMTSLVVAPKRALRYRIVLYEMMGIAAVANAIMACLGPGPCIPVLPTTISFSHGLTAFAFGTSLLLIWMSPGSDAGILCYANPADDAKDALLTTENMENCTVDHPVIPQ